MQTVCDLGQGLSGRGPERALNGVEWTDDEVRSLIECWKRKVPFSKIARKIGRSRKSVVIKACRLGLTTRPYWNDEYLANARRRGQARHCLSCRAMFFSEGPGNRICLQCKDREAWQSGGDFVEPWG